MLKNRIELISTLTILSMSLIITSMSVIFLEINMLKVIKETPLKLYRH